MAQPYQLITPSDPELQVVVRIADNAHIPFDPANRDFIEYQAWLDAGNMPDPAPP